MLLPEDLYNRPPGFGALVVREETPSPLHVGCLADGPMKLNRQHLIMAAPGYRLILLLPAIGGPALSGGPFHLGIPHQSPVETSLPEVHPPGYPRPYLPGPADAQRLCKNDVGRDKGSLGVPIPSKHLLPLRC